MSFFDNIGKKRLGIAVGLVVALIVIIGLANRANAESNFQVYGGFTNSYSWNLTTRDAWAAEVAYSTENWKFAGGWVGSQSLGEDVGAYGYGSVQRIVPLFSAGRFDFHGGVGLMARTNGSNVSYLLPQVWNFALSGGVSYDQLSLEVRHFSNAGFKGDNRGQNILFVGYKF